MSVEASEWAWRQHGMTRKEKLVLLCLADYSGARGFLSNINPADVSSKTGIAEKRIPGILGKLREKGLLENSRLALKEEDM